MRVEYEARGYVVLENGPVYYARDIDKTIE